MKIAVIGSGYVGLVTGTCFAELGNNVICVDIDSDKIESLKKGIMPIFEPGLKELVNGNLKENRLEFTTDMKKAVSEAEVIFICVGTPPKDDGDADLSYVEDVAREIAESMDSYKVIVEKSTVPVETGEKVMETIKENNRNNIEFDVVSNPEFLREGSAIADFMNPDRVVIGTKSKKAIEIMNKLYSPLKTKILVTDIKSAEIIKHASNSFLAAKISFINAVSNICELTGANVEEVAEGMGLDKRISKQFLNAGLGYGGSCFPKDVDAFVHLAEKKGYNFNLLKATQEINKGQRKLFLKKVESAMWNIKDKTVGILGLAFKPNTDDIREAPSIDIITALLKEGAKIKAYDPEANKNIKKLFPDLEFHNDPYGVAKDSDALLILTEWNEFKEMDLKKIKGLMKNSLIIDGRNIYDLDEMKSLGFKYISIGR